MGKNTQEENPKIIGFWEWFFHGSNSSSNAGYKRLISKWAILDFFISIFLVSVVNSSFCDIAGNVLFPLSGVFIGISVAWVGAAHSIIDSDEIRFLGNFHPGGYSEYPYAMQVAVLVLLTTLVLWGLAGIGLLDSISQRSPLWVSYFIGVCLYSSICVSIRMCWKMILYSHQLLLAKYKVKKIEEKNNKQ